MLTLFKAIESVKMGLKRVKKKIGGGKIGPRLGKKIDRLEVYTSPMQCDGNVNEVVVSTTSTSSPPPYSPPIKRKSKI